MSNIFDLTNIFEQYSSINEKYSEILNENKSVFEKYLKTLGFFNLLNFNYCYD